MTRWLTLAVSPCILDSMALPEDKVSIPAPDFRLLFESGPGLYLVLTPQFVIIAVSDAYLRATMTNRAEIVGRRVFDVFPDNPKDPGADGVRNLSASLTRVVKMAQPDTLPILKYDIRRPESAGGGFEERYWSPVNTPICDPSGNVQYIIHRVEDVTAFMKLQSSAQADAERADDLTRRTKEMSSELYLRAQELAVRNEEIERANKLKSEFLTGMSHELRTPLHTIIGFSEVLEEELMGPLNEKQRRYVGYVHRDALHLLELINALLDLSKIEAGRVELTREQIGLADAVDGVVEAIHLRAESKSITLNVHHQKDLTVFTDRLRFRQILLNLVNNAVKFTNEGGRIDIICDGLDDGVEISVRDNGIGIDKDAQASIFDKFYQAGSMDEQAEGTGLGLAITKALIEQHGGRIWVESEVGLGSCFKFTIPNRRREGRAD